MTSHLMELDSPLRQDASLSAHTSAPTADSAHSVLDCSAALISGWNTLAGSSTNGSTVPNGLRDLAPLFRLPASSLAHSA